MVNCEDHWHSMEDKLTPSLMLRGKSSDLPIDLETLLMFE